MKLSVIGLDYDGTIAQRGVLEPSVRDAVATARAAGIVVLLITARMISELRRVVGDLHFVDGIVAKNGAVIHFPQSGHTTILAPAVPPQLPAALGRRGIVFQSGQCLVDADANEASKLLDVIRTLEVPIVLNFNGGRVMASPQGVSKATGLKAALDTLRLSPRNTLAIGDRENDHELLRLAEVGVAVEWGKPRPACRRGHRAAGCRSAGGGGVRAEGRGNRSAANATTRSAAASPRVYRRRS